MELPHFTCAPKDDRPMTSIADQMLVVYCFVDDFLKAHPGQTSWRASNNARPDFTDAEVITIALITQGVPGCLGCASLKQAYRLVANNWRTLFPKLPSYKQWLARLHRGAAIVGMLIQKATLPLEDKLYLMDSKPIAVCKPIRPGRVRLLRDQGAYWGKNKAGWHFGFKLHVLAHHRGAILCAFLTPANVDDRDVAAALADALDGGVLLADLGYQDAKVLEPLLWEEFNMLLITPAHAGQEHRALVSSIRERIETCFSGLWSRFVDRVFWRSWHGLWNTIKLKMLHYNLCQAGVLPPLA
jgi:transposase